MSRTKKSAAGQVVPQGVIEATLRAAEAHGVSAAEVPLRDIALEAGISHSTLVRRIGGSRHALDEALRAAGVEPGGRKPVKERAIEATGHLISTQGLGTVTFERVAIAAECSVPSLYAAFGGRDELLRLVFERYSPTVDVEALLATSHGDLADTVRRLTRLIVDTLEREPRVLQALLAEVFARPGDDNVRAVLQTLTPRLLSGLGAWLAAEAAAGRVRDLPPMLLTQLMTGPIFHHFLLRPVTSQVAAADLPSKEETIETFAQAFLRAVALPSPDEGAGPRA
ncbi:TetR/AcrR family transcriptional regulator [Streptomyces sp. NBC_00006]|uniref:TetR/AcrR family transcriptional regulator n=1 Tax=unclassified Streptomyces TaxID=2593676 RepID=UPI00225AD2B3|nr:MULTISPECIES: TetR family transcriptional regulator [unclassified Streptomyces]MCX5535814.1 TetR/AcrR family transcriptional regulator [Streptomyces sp. NBC_00006]